MGKDEVDCDDKFKAKHKIKEMVSSGDEADDNGEIDNGNNEKSSNELMIRMKNLSMALEETMNEVTGESNNNDQFDGVHCGSEQP